MTRCGIFLHLVAPMQRGSFVAVRVPVSLTVAGYRLQLVDGQWVSV